MPQISSKEKRGGCMFIAVVCRGIDKPVSAGATGGWTAFIGNDQHEVVGRALKHCETTNVKYAASLRAQAVHAEQ
jgi:hypothetical protein